MGPKKPKSKGEHINYLWDELNLSERLDLVLDYAEHFLEEGLITPPELVAAAGLPQNEWEYILNREKQPIFSRLHLKENVVTQNMRLALRSVLKRVFK